MSSAYSLDGLMNQYGLPRAEAERILKVTGSLKADVDALMAVKSRRATASNWILDPYEHVPSAGKR
jgi:hypothetical protein